MEKQKNQPMGGWYSSLMTGLETMAEGLELENEQRQILREFIVRTAKEQYAAGNRAGIRWSRLQMEKEKQAG